MVHIYFDCDRCFGLFHASSEHSRNFNQFVFHLWTLSSSHLGNKKRIVHFSLFIPLNFLQKSKNGLMLIFFMKPFEIGDRIIIPDCPVLIISKINILNTIGSLFPFFHHIILYHKNNSKQLFKLTDACTSCQTARFSISTTSFSTKEAKTTQSLSTLTSTLQLLLNNWQK